MLPTEIFSPLLLIIVYPVSGKSVRWNRLDHPGTKDQRSISPEVPSSGFAFLRLPVQFFERFESMTFWWENVSMRKLIINTTEPKPPGTSDEWLNIEEIARVELSSEDPRHPIESAFKHGKSPGWRADRPGEQTIRLLFDEPKDVRRISLRFSESQVERTQQFTLRWADSQTGSFSEIVRQQWNFNPRNSTTEVEDYKVDLHHVLALELTVDPDLGKNGAFATLADWRVA